MTKEKAKRRWDRYVLGGPDGLNVWPEASTPSIRTRTARQILRLSDKYPSATIFKLVPVSPEELKK